MAFSTNRHPVFANEHNPGQKTTQHRSIERARQAVAVQGRHPEAGQFQRDYDSEYNKDQNGMMTSRKGDATHDVRHYQAPSGARIEMSVEHPDWSSPQQDNRDPHDLQVNVNGTNFSQPAAKEYMGRRFGLPV